MNPEQANPAQVNPGRDEKGRFTFGNKGGPGNPFARKVAALRQALIDSVTAQDIQDVAAALLAQAKGGDVPAAKLLFAYAIGKPQPAPEPDRMDADEWDVLKDTAEMKKEAPTVMNTATPDYYLNSVHAFRPAVAFLNQMEIEKIVSETPEQIQAREDAEAAECERMLKSPAPGFAAQADEAAPSPNGVNGQAPPSANGQKRPAPQGTDRLQPSTNGDFRHA